MVRPSGQLLEKLMDCTFRSHIHRLTEPGLRDRHVGILESVGLAPERIGRTACLGDAGLGAREDEAKVDLRMLLLDKEMLLSIRSQKSPLGLQHYPVVQQHEIWCVLARFSGLEEWER